MRVRVGVGVGVWIWNANGVLCLAESTKKAQKAHHGNGMSKMKETLSKVTHPRHNERH